MAADTSRAPAATVGDDTVAQAAEPSDGLPTSVQPVRPVPHVVPVGQADEERAPIWTLLMIVVALGLLTAGALGWSSIRRNGTSDQPADSVLSAAPVASVGPAEPVAEDAGNPPERDPVVGSDGGETVSEPGIASSPPATSATNVPLQTIRTVPAIPELIVEIDGEIVVADATGVIDVGSIDPDASIEVIGVWSEPVTVQVEFITWSDGVSTATRTLSDAPGPELSIGFEERRQVVVELDETVSELDVVRFRSGQAVQISVPVGEPTWVVSRRAKLVDGMLAVELVEYTASPFQGLSSTEVYRPVQGVSWLVR